MNDPERTKVLAQSLLEMLTPYEEELIALERDAPGLVHLRRAVSIAIAEACYCIGDHGPAVQWTASASDPAGEAG